MYFANKVDNFSFGTWFYAMEHVMVQYQLPKEWIDMPTEVTRTKAYIKWEGSFLTHTFPPWSHISLIPIIVRRRQKSASEKTSTFGK